MSLIVSPVSQPAVPSASTQNIYSDSADNRLKQILPDGHTDVFSPMGLRDRNVLDNGGQGINQRVATALTNIAGLSTTVRTFVNDRWFVMTGNTTMLQYAQIDTIASPVTNLNTRWYSQLKQITNGAKFLVGQVVLGPQVPQFWGKTMRFQAKMRYGTSASGTTVRMILLQSNSSATVDSICGGAYGSGVFVTGGAFGVAGTDPTWGSNLSEITPTTCECNYGTAGVSIVGSGITCTLTNVFQRFSGTFVIPSGCVNLICVLVINDVPTANDDLQYSEVGLYPGQEIRDWVDQPFATELVRCMRTFQKSFAYATVPAQSVAAGPVVAVAGVTTTGTNYLQYEYAVPFRATPAIVTWYNPTASNANAHDITHAGDASGAMTSVYGTEKQMCYSFAGLSSIGAVGDAYVVHFAADAEI